LHLLLVGQGHALAAVRDRSFLAVRLHVQQDSDDHRSDCDGNERAAHEEGDDCLGRGHGSMFARAVELLHPQRTRTASAFPHTWRDDECADPPRNRRARDPRKVGAASRQPCSSGVRSPEHRPARSELIRKKGGT
jgi:hypothetical protein